MGNFMRGMENNKQPIAILLEDGKVVELKQTLRAADIMISYPHHVLCNASSVLSGRQGKVLPPHSVLQYGNVYFLIPLTIDDETTGHPFCSNGSDADPLVQKETSKERRGSAKFVIPQELLQKIISDRRRNSRKKKCRGTAPKQPLRRKSSLAWSPVLESISELAVQ